MKVLCFHPALAPYRVDLFNLLAERVEFRLVLLQRNLINQKFDQEVLLRSLRCSVMFSRGLRLGGRFVPFDVLFQLNAFHPEVVLAYEASPITLVICAWVMLRKCLRSQFGVKVWTFMDDAPNLISGRRGLRRIIRNWVLRRVDGVIAPSKEALEAYQDLGVWNKAKAPSLVSVPIVHDSGVALRSASVVRKEAEAWRGKHLRNGEFALFFIGRLAAVKNLRWLVAQTESPDWPKSVKLFIVGEGEERKSIQGKAVLLGRHEGGALQVFFSAADALVLPSSYEPFGAVVAEALQWGVPVLVSDRVGARTLVNDGNGVVYPHDNVVAFLSGLKRVLSLGRSNESRLSVSLRESVMSLIEQL